MQNIHIDLTEINYKILAYWFTYIAILHVYMHQKVVMIWFKQMMLMMIQME